MRQAPRPDWLAPWLVLLVQNARDLRSEFLDYALSASRWPEDRMTAMLLFDHLAEPQVSFRQPFGRGGGRFDLRVRGSDHWLRQAWEGMFAPNLPDAAPDLLVVLDRHLRRAHQMLTAAAAAEPAWDPLSLSRPAIESGPQYPDSLDLMIDAARDCLEALLDAGLPLGPARLCTWAESDVPLLRRLAVHGWSHRQDVDATTKIAWLRDHRLLFDDRLRYEVLRLIEVALSQADVDVADALVAETTVGPADTGERRDYEIFRVLSWIVRQAPQLRSAIAALEQVAAAHPEFAQRPPPDLPTLPESVPGDPEPAMSSEELHRLIEADAAEAVLQLRHREKVTPPFGVSTFGDALSVLVRTVQGWPSDGFAVLDHVDNELSELVAAVIRGWASATLDHASAEAVIARLRTLDLSVIGDDVARLLFEGGRSESSPTKWHELRSARLLATELWTATPSEAPEVGANRWLERAISHRAGRIAEFWVRAISAEWRRAGDAWTGLPTDAVQQLDAMLDAPDDRGIMAEVILTSQLHFFFRAERDWCERRLLPLLGWEHAESARRNWGGFLSWGRWDDQLLSAGLLGHYLATATHLGDFDEELRRQYHQHLASVAVSSEINPVDNRWALTFSATVLPAERAAWLQQIGWMLERLPAEAVEHQWARWMRRYWQDRLQSIPVTLTFEEASAMAGWVVFLTDSLEEGTLLATACPAGIPEHSTLLHHLTEERVTAAPEAVATLLVHLLTGSHAPFYEHHVLAQVVRWLRSCSPQPDIHPIIEQAVRLGCGDAPAW